MPSTTSDQRTKGDTLTEWTLGTEVTFEPVSANPYELSYACLIIPRFSTHYLVGDLADNLYIWMKEICISFGWRLDFLSVQPDYLQWIICVPPATSPANFMSIIRQQTSQEILDNFPRNKKGKSFQRLLGTWLPCDCKYLPSSGNDGQGIHSVDA